MFSPPFADRQQAGEYLAQDLQEYRDQPAVVFGIPRGGVAVGYSVAQILHLPLDVIVPRKIPIPWHPEAGVGAVCADGTLVLNEPLLNQLELTVEGLHHVIESVRHEIIRRTEVYRGDRPLTDLNGKTAIVVDDGLATGYTMVAALLSLKKLNPKELIAAVPVSPRESLHVVQPFADRIICPVVSDHAPFAVGSFYRSFPEMSDEEVADLLSRAQSRLQEAA